MDIQAYRDLFPITAEYTYLNTAAMSPLPSPVAEAIDRHVQQMRTQPLDAILPEIMLMEEAVKERAARLVGAARADEMVQVPGTATGINIAAKSLPLRPGDNVLVLDGDYPAVIYPWLNMAPQGILTKIVPQINGGLDLDLLEARIDSHTRVVSISTAMFATGFRNDMQTLGLLCKAHDIYLVVDAIQTLGYLPMDVQACNIDFLACGSHKWLMSPSGSGILFCRHALLEELQLGSYVGARSVVDSMNFLDYNFTLENNSARFGVGVWDFLSIVSMHASLGLILEADVERIGERVLSLTGLAIAELQDRGLHILSCQDENHRSGLVLLEIPDAVGVCERLFSERIVVSPRGHGVRLSPNFWNTEEEICRAVDAMAGLASGSNRPPRW